MVQALAVSFWVWFLMNLRKNNLHFYFFMLGSIGLFVISMYYFSSVLEGQLTYLVSLLLQVISKWVPIFELFPEYGMINVQHFQETISFFIDYECSGFIETLVFVSLLMFYPLYSVVSKSVYSMIGIFFIMAANAMRITVICGIVKVFGANSFFIAHTLVARVFFFYFDIDPLLYCFYKTAYFESKSRRLIYT